MADYVLDASAALSWVLPRQSTSAADGLLAHDPPLTFLAPRHFALEVRSGLLKAERLGRSTADDTAASAALIASVPVEFEESDSDGRIEAASRLARSHKVSLYDALYLDLALRSGLPVASRDRRMLEGARGMGLKVYDALGAAA